VVGCAWALAFELIWGFCAFSRRRAYLPLFYLQYPAPRLAFLSLGIRRARVLFTHSSFAGSAALANANARSPWCGWMLMRGGHCRAAHDALRCFAQAHHPAYVIYTSGSTGMRRGWWSSMLASPTKSWLGNELHVGQEFSAALLHFVHRRCFDRGNHAAAGPGGAVTVFR